jgi:hypothetical protein
MLNLGRNRSRRRPGSVAACGRGSMQAKPGRRDRHGWNVCGCRSTYLETYVAVGRSRAKRIEVCRKVRSSRSERPKQVDVSRGSRKSRLKWIEKRVKVHRTRSSWVAEVGLASSRPGTYSGESRRKSVEVARKVDRSGSTHVEVGQDVGQGRPR